MAGILPPWTIGLWVGTQASLIGSGDFTNDCKSGNLPAVSFVDPAFTMPCLGDGTDDHPDSDIRYGEAFLARIYNAVVSSPAWSNTVLVINFDEWGGFFDHVAPAVAEVPDQEQAAYAAVGRALWKWTADHLLAPAKRA